MKGGLLDKVLRVLAGCSILAGGAVSLALAALAISGRETSPAWAIVLFIAFYAVQSVIFSSSSQAIAVGGMMLALGLIILMFGDLLQIQSVYNSLENAGLHYFFIGSAVLIWLSLSLKISKRRR